MDGVASEVSRSIGSILNEYRKGAREIEDKYKLKYRGLAAGEWLTVGAMLIPHLAPLIAAVPVIALGGGLSAEESEKGAIWQPLSRHFQHSQGSTNAETIAPATPESLGSEFGNQRNGLATLCADRYLPVPPTVILST